MGWLTHLFAVLFARVTALEARVSALEKPSGPPAVLSGNPEIKR